MKTLFHRFPYGFYFNTTNGAFVFVGDVWQTDGVMWTIDNGQRHGVVRVHPWELL